MHGFGTLNALVPGHYLLRQLIRLKFLYMGWRWNTQPPVDCESALKYSVILFVNLGEYIMEFMQ